MSIKSVTLTDLRRNLEEYLKQVQAGDIVITRYGKTVGRLTAADAEAASSETLAIADSGASTAS